jgi:ankyrin repeat protein
MNVGNAPEDNASDERRRTSFLRAIRQQDDAVAELYLAGLQLVGDNAFPGRAPLIAHVVRELLNNIPRDSLI